MTDYLPTTDEVRGSLVFLNKHYAEQRADVDVDLLVVESETAAQFDRMIAEVERAAAARELEEAAEAIRKERPEMGMHILPTPYRDGKCHGIDLAETIVTARAAEIREGKGE